MDYEKEYKAALERAKEFMSVRGVSPYEDALECAKELSETIFPQLAESKDEKIRKELIKIVSKFQPEVWKELSETPQSVFIAWLKKQGKQEKSIKEKLMALSDGKQHLGWLDDADKVIESEQKSADKV